MPADLVASRVDPAEFSWSAEAGPAAEVRRVVDAATATDGRSPLNEATLLALRHAGLEHAVLHVARPADGGEIVGFSLAHVAVGTHQPVDLNVVVAPNGRRRGAGHLLVGATLEDRTGQSVAAWSHGNHPAAARLAAAHGFDRVRDLWVMRRRLDVELPALPGDGGAPVVRTFRAGQDEDAFLRVNAAAFAHHPEQGSMTRADLDARMAEPWFDPAGFFLAVDDAGELLGFHWTKVHSASLGEVYVVGISPQAQGGGLGKLLTLTGLHHLADRGLDEVLLYVEADNAPAVAVYERLGFTHADADTDVMYLRPGQPSA